MLRYCSPRSSRSVQPAFPFWERENFPGMIWMCPHFDIRSEGELALRFWSFWDNWYRTSLLFILRKQNIKLLANLEAMLRKEMKVSSRLSWCLCLHLPSNFHLVGRFVAALSSFSYFQTGCLVAL